MKAASILLLFGAIGSCFLTLFSMKMIDWTFSFEMFVVGIMLMSIVCVWCAVSERHSTVIVLLCIFSISFTLNFMPSARFNVLGGSDNLGEYFVARATLEQGRWPPSFEYVTTATFREKTSPSAFSSCLSVTVLPAIISSIAGIDLLQLFRMLPAFMGALLAIAIYVVVKSYFGVKSLAVLSAILFSQHYYNFQFLSEHMRQQVAEIFLVISLLLIVKIQRNSKQRVPLSVLLVLAMAGIVFSHYTVAYFSIPIFLAFFFLPEVLERFGKGRLGRSLEELDYSFDRYRHVFFMFIVLLSAWGSFIYSRVFVQHLEAPVNAILKIWKLENQPSAFFSSPLRVSPLISSWFVLGAILIGSGCLYLVAKENNALRRSWVSGGLMMVLLMMISLLVPGISHSLNPPRIFEIGLIFFCCFLAQVLILLGRPSKKLAVVAFLILNLQFNALLLSHSNYVLYHVEESVDPQQAVAQSYNRYSDFLAAIWIRQHCEKKEILSVDIRGYFAMFYTDNSLLTVDQPRFAVDSKYLILHYFAIRYGLWTHNEGDLPWAPIVATPKEGETYAANISALADLHNIVYNNDETWLLARRPK